MEKDGQISVPVQGMNRDAHISRLKNTETPFALNSNTESETGGQTTYKNEPSNTLSVVFPEGYKVIHAKKHLPSNKTYYWLTNPTTKKSSIGYVESVLRDVFNDDEYKDCGDCEKNGRTLGEPLENTSQAPDSTYVELVNDICLPIGEGLNFDINKPIKFLHIKTEKGSTTAYWNDYNNPPRYMVLSDISYLYKVEIPCEDDEQAECIQVEKLLQFPNHRRIKITADKVQTGGNLKFGKYEFYAAYCDAQGNNLTNYSTPTNPVDIFDENNNILTQTDLDTFTNFAIRLKVENLDKNFKYYKVVCLERSSVDSTQSVFLEGIHPTTDDTVLYTSSGSSSDSIYNRNGNVSIKKRMDLQELFQVRPTYDKAKGTMSSGGRQYMWGLYKRPEVNLQPVVNLFGALMKWQSSAAKEDLYKSPIATSKFKGWMRNEVQPYALRFFYKNGDYTSNFPIVARPAIGTDKATVDVNSDTFKSISENTPDCTDDGRTQNWQIFNTATQDGICESYSENATEIQEKVKRTCIIKDVAEIPTDTINIQLQTNYTNLTDYIQDNYNDVIDPSSDKYISEIAPYLIDTYPNNHCVPNFQGDCEEAVLLEESNIVNGIENEQTSYVEKCIENYLKTIPPTYCNMFKIDTATGEYVRDTDFENAYMPCNQQVYKREGTFQNEDCAYAPDVQNNNVREQSGQTYIHNYKGDAILANLMTNRDVIYTSTYFKSKLHKGALFYRIKKNGRDKIVLEITKNSECSTADAIAEVNQMRYTMYANCSSTTPLTVTIVTPEGCPPNSLTPGLVDTTKGIITILDVSTYPEEFFIALDNPIVEESVPANRIDCMDNSTKYRTAPACGCYSIYTRDQEFASIDVSWDSISIDKVETYESQCTFFVPEVDECDPVPYAYGKFAYNESTREYPDNAELYDSSNLRIREDYLSLLTAEDKTDFEQYFTQGSVNGVYNLKTDTDFRCKPIRHPKMPDNSLSPFMSDINSAPFSEAIIFPLGVMLDSKIVRTMLIVALNNELITKDQYDNIDGYEILKGDNTVHKSVIANGLGYDMYKYSKESNDYYYANYPHNDLGRDILHYSTEARTSLIAHPYEGNRNNRFSFLSPDLLLTKPALPTEAVISGYQTGSANTMFTDVEDHPQWTILGKDARTTADILSTAEVLLELAIKIAEFSSQSALGNLWVAIGLGSSGGNFIGIPGALGILGAYGLVEAAQQFFQRGKYRYDWIKIFRDLGTAYNFASYGISHGHHNNFIKNTDKTSYIRGLSSKKYLKKGRYTIRDKNITGDKLYINNFLREESAFISTGDYFFNYSSEYSTYDNNSLSLEQGSRSIMSQNDCQSDVEFQRNVGSPYITLKNYVPDQFGDIDSVKWLTTNESFKLDETTTCRTIFGGNVSISRFTWKRKLPIFTKDIVGTANRIPFNYYDYKNIGYPRFYCNYEEDSIQKVLGVPFPDIDSNYNFDCETGNRGFYVRPPSKMYLYSYGITDFLVESEINCNFRYGGKELKDQFYPQTGDIVEWTQQKNVSITEPNTLYYNNIYSLPVSNTPYRYLDNTYSKELWEMRNKQDNAVIMSEEDNSENALTDPWLVFKPLNWYEFKKDKGTLISLKDLENGQILANFEDGQTLFNVVDNLADRITPQTKNLGIGSIFGNRPLEFKMTDLGFAGTQHSDMLSTPYGHFKVDAKRGKVFRIDQNGQNLEAISEQSGKNATNMKNWFKENLPFEILKTFPDIDIDNKYKGIGISMGWDERFGRLFLTKKDYRLKKGDLIQCNNSFYDSDLSSYQDIINSYIQQGFKYEGVEDCQLKFNKKQLNVTTTTDIYVYFDTTSMTVEDATAALNGINSWFSNFQTSNPTYSGNFYTIPTIQERYLLNIHQIQQSSNQFPNINSAPEWSAFLNLPPNANSISFVPPSDLLVINFLDEAEPTYHNTSENSYGSQPMTGSNNFVDNYMLFKNSVTNFNNFRCVTYPIVRNSGFQSGATKNLILHLMAAIEGTTLTQEEIDATGTTVNVSSILTSNPYDGYILPDSTVYKPLKDYNFVAFYDKVSPAVDVFNSEQFQEDLASFTNIGNNFTEEITEYISLQEVELENEEYFEQISWTISYKPTEASWQSYWTFAPDYYVNQMDFFQIGWNYGEHAEKLWSHYLGNQSFQVFQGKLEPWIVEVPLENKNVQKILSTIYVDVEAKRYNSNWDYAENSEVGFNKMVVYNGNNNSGELYLNLQKSLRDIREYPKTNGNSSQDILYSTESGKHKIDYFFNRVKNQNNNVPLWLWDQSRVDKTVNPQAISFYGKKPLERMRGEQFIIRLQQDKESRYGMELKTVQTESINYR